MLGGLTDEKLRAMHAAANMPPNILDPATVRDLVEKLSDEEGFELDAYANRAQSPDDFAIRASSWLIRKFDLHAQTAKGVSS